MKYASFDNDTVQENILEYVSELQKLEDAFWEKKKNGEEESIENNKRRQEIIKLTAEVQQIRVRNLTGETRNFFWYSYGHLAVKVAHWLDTIISCILLLDDTGCTVSEHFELSPNHKSHQIIDMSVIVHSLEGNDSYNNTTIPNMLMTHFDHNDFEVIGRLPPWWRKKSIHYVISDILQSPTNTIVLDDIRHFVSEDELKDVTFQHGYNLQNFDVELRHACYNGHKGIVEYMLSKNREQLDYKNIDVLMGACSSGHIEIIKLLLDSGFDPFIKKACGKNLLMFACQCGNFDIVQLVINQGVDPRICDNKGENALLYIFKIPYYLKSSKKNDIIAIIRLLIARGVDPHITDVCGKNLVISAFNYFRDAEILELLLNSGLSVPEHYFNQIWLWAKKKGYINLWRLLATEKARQMGSEHINTKVDNEWARKRGTKKMFNFTPTRKIKMEPHTEVFITQGLRNPQQCLVNISKCIFSTYDRGTSIQVADQWYDDHF